MYLLNYDSVLKIWVKIIFNESRIVLRVGFSSWITLIYKIIMVKFIVKYKINYFIDTVCTRRHGDSFEKPHRT